MSVILHSDLNCFYASVEMNEQPQLKGKKVAVCGSTENRHGIVLTASYPAKRSGVKTGMANWQAKQACPGLIMVDPHYDLYLKYSRIVRRIYQRYSEIIEPFGMDENWIQLALLTTGEDAKSAWISGEQVFKYTAAGAVSPAQITLTANLQNVTMGKWQYKNSSGNWTDYPTTSDNASITGTTLIVKPKKHLAELRDQGYTYQQIAEASGIGLSSVKMFFKRNNTPADDSGICAQCKKRLEKDAPKKKRFCSEKCRIKWWAEHPEQLSNAREHQYKCPVCCKVFYSYKPAKFCSLTCYHRSRRKAGGKDA